MEIQQKPNFLLKFHLNKIFLELGDPFAKIKLKIRIKEDEQETKRFSAKKECNLDEKLNFKLKMSSFQEEIKDLNVKIILIMLKKDNESEIGELTMNCFQILKEGQEKQYTGIFEFLNSDPYCGKIEMSLKFDEIEEEKEEEMKAGRKEKIKRAGIKTIHPFSSSDEEKEKKKKKKEEFEEIENEIKSHHNNDEEKNLEILLLKEELENLKNVHQIEQEDIQNKIVLLCNELEQKEREIKNLNEKVESTKNSSESVETQEKIQIQNSKLEKKEKEIENLIQKIDHFQTLIEKKEKIIKTLETELFEKNRLFEEKERSLHEGNEINKMIDDEKIELKKMIEKLGLENEEKGRKIKNFEMQINQINKEGLMNNIETLSKMLDERNKHIANLEKEIEEKNQKIIELKNTYDNFNNKIDDFQLAILNKNNEIEKYKVLIEAINKEKESLSLEIKEKDNNILNLQVQIEEKTRILENFEVENLNVSYQTQENEKYSKEKECLLQSLEKECNDIKNEYETKLNVNENKNFELSKILEQRQNEIIYLKKEINDLTKNLEMQEKIENLNKDLQSKLDDLNQEINQNEEKTTEITIQNQKLSDNINILNENVAELEGLKSKNSELTTKNKELSDKTNFSNEKIIELESHNKQLRKEILMKEGRLSDVEGLYNKLQGDFVRTKQELADTINLIFDKGSTDIMEELEELLVKNSTLQ